MTVSFAFRKMVVASAFATVALCGATAAHAEATGFPAGSLAAEIAKMYGRERGLCAIIGVGQTDAAQLAAEFAASGKILVHGIALDAESLRRAREAVSSRGADGFATIEELSLSPLPYRDNLVDLMVVPDLAAASAAGFSKSGALRAVAPLGTLCIRSQGKWTVARKEVPAGMDEWTHNIHGPDGNRASKDQVVSFPVGYRWHGGLPFNINNRQRQGNRYSATRGIAVVGGRCFTFSDSVIENLRGAYFLGQRLDEYVTARDAFNGLFLWRRKIGQVYYGGLWYENLAPFAAVGDSVYTVTEGGDLVVLDAETGRERRTLDTTYAPGELLVDRGVLAVATWRGGAWVGESKVNRYERRRMHSAVAEGTVEAYDVASGARLWLRTHLATSIRSADGVLFMVQREGRDLLEESRRFKPKTQEKKPHVTDKKVVYQRPAQAIVAVDLRTGKQLWEVSSQTLSGDDYRQEALRLGPAGLGVVTVVHCQDLRSGKVSVLAAKDGKCLLQTKGGSLPLLLDNTVHIGGKTYDPATGKETGASPLSIGTTVCTPSLVVNNIVVRNRGGAYTVNGKPVSYAGARGACGMASVPAYGAFYTPQNWCTCCPPQISGFICFGPVRSVPTEQEMVGNPVVARGPAFGETPATDQAGSETDWPMYRHGPSRNSATPASAPMTLKVRWQKQVPLPRLDGPVALNWREYLNTSLTAPNAACGVVVTAAMDANQVVGLDLEDGKLLWRFTAGARIDSSPTVYRGVCLFGAHDGFVYALDCRSGALRWKMRMAPNEERMMSYGKVESPWPVVGSVLVEDGVAYASAGRTQGSDGGIVVRAFSPFTGKIVWSRALPSSGNLRALRRNDLMLKTGGSLQLMITRLDPKTGEFQPNPTREVNVYHQRVGRLKRSAAIYRKRLAAAGGKSPTWEKALKKAESALHDLKEPESEIAPSLGKGGRGSEGYVHWNWSRLGYRKFVQMNYGNIGGTLVGWDKKSVCTMARERRVSLYSAAKVGRAGEKLTQRPDWSLDLPSTYQVTSLVLCSNAVVAAGGVYDETGNKKDSGFVCVISRDTGHKKAEHVFASPVVYNGIAVVEQGICAAFKDGSACLLNGLGTGRGR